MNYIKQINYYWQKHDELLLSGKECALYMYLLKRSNLIGWQNPVEIWNSVALEALKLRFRELQFLRARLQQYNLIRHKTVNGSPVVVYLIYDAESKEEPRTFFENMAFTAKNNAKPDGVIPEEPPNPGPEEEKTPVVIKAEKKIVHDIFCEDFFAPEHEYDRHALCTQAREAEIKKDWVQVFNSHLITERKKHEKYQEWLKHLRCWLLVKLPELKKIEYDNRNQSKSKHGKIEVDIIL